MQLGTIGTIVLKIGFCKFECKFEGSVKELGWTVEKSRKYENDDPMWKLVVASPHFYPNLKPLHGAIDFFDTAIMLPS